MTILKAMVQTATRSKAQRRTAGRKRGGPRPAPVSAVVALADERPAADAVQLASSLVEAAPEAAPQPASLGSAPAKSGRGSIVKERPPPPGCAKAAGEASKSVGAFQPSDQSALCAQLASAASLKARTRCAAGGEGRKRKLTPGSAPDDEAEPLQPLVDELNPECDRWCFLQVIKAMNPKPRTYLTGVPIHSTKRRLIVEITSAMSPNHEKHILAIKEAMLQKPMRKADALLMRAELLNSDLPR